MTVHKEDILRISTENWKAAWSRLKGYYPGAEYDLYYKGIHLTDDNAPEIIRKTFREDYIKLWMGNPLSNKYTY